MDESILHKLFNDSLTQYNATQALNLNVPEFHGLPNEDVNKFIKKFRAATIGFPIDSRCRLIKKALKDSAQNWSKSILKTILSKETFDKQDWERIRELLRQRFSDSDLLSIQRQQLTKMSYKEGDVLLSCYVEDFLACYKRAYPNHDTSEALQALQTNLPHRIIVRLNYLNADWTDIKSDSELTSLVRKLETKILPFEPREDNATPINEKSLLELFSGLKSSVEDLIKNTVKKATEETTTLQLALMDKQAVLEDNEHNNVKQTLPGRRFSYRNQRNYRPYKRVYNSNDNPIDKKNKTDRDQDDNQSIHHEPAVTDLEQSYYEKYRKPSRPCSHCNGTHWDKHCPLLNLK